MFLQSIQLTGVGDTGDRRVTVHPQKHTATFRSCFLERSGDFLEEVLRHGEEGNHEERKMRHKSYKLSDPQNFGLDLLSTYQNNKGTLIFMGRQCNNRKGIEKF